jgi:amino-acid N-acetyltransferase
MNKPVPSFKIRPAQFEDQKNIHTILSDFNLPLEGLDSTKLWVLQLDNGEIVGVAGLEMYDMQCLLRSVAVLKAFHNQSFGTYLTNFVIVEAKKSQVKDLFLLTTTATEFFKKLGFKEESREKVVGGIINSVEFRSACPKTAVLMHLKLS